MHISCAGFTIIGIAENVSLVGNRELQSALNLHLYDGDIFTIQIKLQEKYKITEIILGAALHVFVNTDECYTDTSIQDFNDMGRMEEIHMYVRERNTRLQGFWSCRGIIGANLLLLS